MNQEVNQMKNEHMYKKLKYELTLNFLYNTNKYHKSYRQTLLNICQYFNVEFNNKRFDTIVNFGCVLGMILRRDAHCLFYNDKMLMDYANAHNIRLYDMKEHKLVISIEYTTFQYKP